MRSLALLTALLLLVPAAPCLAAADWAWPVRGQVLTEFRNGDDPYAAGQHRGIDIGAPVGTPVVAPVSGSVEFAGVVGSSGLVVSQRTTDGRYDLSYLHLSSIAVHRGDAVGRGERLGAVGVSGTRSAEAPHLHFGVRESGDHHAYLDPLTFLAPPPAEAPEPRTVPAPVAAPVPASPAPAPVPVVAGAPVRAGVQVPARVPNPAAHLVAAPAARHSSARHVPAHASPGQAADPARPVAHAHDPAPRHAALPAHGPAAGPAAPGAAAARAAAGAPRHHGVDLGWLAACLGLVVAAGLLAAPSRGGRNLRALFRALGRSERRSPPVAFDSRWPTTSQPRSTT